MPETLPPSVQQPAQAGAAGHPVSTMATPTAAEIRHALSLAAHQGTDFVVGRFKQIDFNREVWPLDATAARKLSSEPAFWAITLLAALPLFFGTLSQRSYQLEAFVIYFAVIWGMIFRFNVVPGVKIGWNWLAGTLLFTGTAGLFLLLLVYRFLPAWYMNLTDSQSALTRLFGFLFQTGICEELCKIFPVALLMLFFREKLRYGDIVMLGVFSGLGFAAFENLQYFSSVANSHLTAIGAVAADPNATAASVNQYIFDSEHESMILALTRTISCTFGHATYCAVFAHFLAQGRGAGIKQLPMWIIGLAMAAFLHGMYDWLGAIQETLPVLSTVVSFMLLKLYIVEGTATAAVAQQTIQQVGPAAVAGSITDPVLPTA